MTGPDLRSLLEDGTVDADLRQALALLASLADEPAPPPSAALEDLLDRGFEPTAVPFRRPPGILRRGTARAGAGLMAAAASVVVAGTAAALPAPVQEVVADLVGALTPFELPRPPAVDDQQPAGPDGNEQEPDPPASVGPPARAATAGADAAAPTSPADRPVGEADGSAPVEHQRRAEAEAVDTSTEVAQDAEDDAADDAEHTVPEAEDREPEQEDPAEEPEDDEPVDDEDRVDD